MGLRDNDWLDARIAKTKSLIEQYEDAQLQLSSGAVQTYSIDTGQTRQSVTKANLVSIGKTIDNLYLRLEILEARRYGHGVIYGRPVN